MPPHTDPHRWAVRPSGLSRFLPIAGWLPRYDRGFLRPDVIAGATVWGLLVPESIAYAGLAGLAPEAGLYALLATLAAYAVFGTSRHLIAGPTSAAAVLLASSVGDLASSGSAEYVADAAMLVLLCGALFLVAGLLRRDARGRRRDVVLLCGAERFAPQLPGGLSRRCWGSPSAASSACPRTASRSSGR